MADLVWTGLRLGNHFEHLGGERVLPHWTKIGERWLRIDGDVHFIDVKGKSTGIDEGPFTAAMYVAEKNPTWIWSDTEPD